MLGRRTDATPADHIHPYRRIMPYIMRGRNESAFYFEQDVDLSVTADFIARFNAERPTTPISLFHVVLWAFVQTLHARPRLNRFVAGGRLWQRDGIWVTYAAKKQRLDDDAPLVTLKRRFDPDMSFEELVAGFYSDLREGRSDTRSHTDKELGLLLRLPGPLLRAFVAFARFADRFGLLPRFFVEGDPMFTSVFLANMGSLKMDSGWHHLYEYGNCPIFCVVGRARDVAAVENGPDGSRLVSRRVASLRYTYDERVEDGLYAENSLVAARAMVEDPEAHGAKVPHSGPR